MRVATGVSPALGRTLLDLAAGHGLQAEGLDAAGRRVPASVLLDMTLGELGLAGLALRVFDPPNMVPDLALTTSLRNRWSVTPRSEREVITHRLLLKYAEHLEIHAKLNVEERFKQSLEAFVASLSEPDLKRLVDELESAFLHAALTGDFEEALDHLSYGYGGGALGKDLDLILKNAGHVYEFKKAKNDLLTRRMISTYIDDMRKKMKGSPVTRDRYLDPGDSYPAELVLDLRDCTNIHAMIDPNTGLWDIRFEYTDSQTGIQETRWLNKEIKTKVDFYRNPSHIPIGLKFNIRILLPAGISGPEIKHGAFVILPDLL